MFGDGRLDEPGGAVRGRTTYALPVFEKIIRRATAGNPLVRLEPLASVGRWGFLLRWRPRLAAERAGRRLRLAVPLQVALGWPIPQLARQAQQAIAAEIRRLTDYEDVIIDVRVSGAFAPELEVRP